MSVASDDRPDHELDRDLDGGVDDDLHRGGLTAAVHELLDAVHDLKHDVRMLKVGLDKQQRLLEELTDGSARALRLGDQPAEINGDDDLEHRRAG